MARITHFFCTALALVEVLAAVQNFFRNPPTGSGINFNNILQGQVPILLFDFNFLENSIFG